MAGVLRNTVGYTRTYVCVSLDLNRTYWKLCICVGYREECYTRSEQWITNGLGERGRGL